MAHEKEWMPVQELTAAAGGVINRPQVNVGFTVAAETGGNSITVTCQVRQWNDNLAGYRWFPVWLSATAGGAADATGNAVTIGGGTTVVQLTLNAVYLVQTSSTGSFTVANVVAGVADRYVNVGLPNGEVASQVISYA